MKLRSNFFRHVVNAFFVLLSSMFACIAAVFLFWIVWKVVVLGISGMSLSFFTELPYPPGEEGGGLAHAIVGSVIITLGGMLLGVPLGVLGGIYAVEYAHPRFREILQLACNVLAGVPSIIVGLFVYTLLVLPLRTYSAYAGMVALAIIMVPIVFRATENMFSLAPNTLRESALALGIPYYRMVAHVLLPAVKSGVITGILLGVSRIAGETAPLIFTVLNSQVWFHSLLEPIPNLPVTIYQYAMAPYANWQNYAWAGTFLIMLVVLTLNTAARTRVFSLIKVKDLRRKFYE